ncbi:MAG: hypothetical protein DVB29_01595 [Verrucomicrobia bacterium]|nr:MAG: hypothetical protein DVB29_01595 [Verrucomicrobiota bacterium]
MLLGQYDYRQRGSCGRDCRKATTRRARRARASESNYSRRRNPSPSLTRSLPFVSPFQGCPLKPGQSPPRSPDRRWFLYQDSRRLATNQYEICGLIEDGLSRRAQKW